MHRQINFNKIFVLQSLRDDDLKTGENLHNDLLSRKAAQMPGFDTVLIDVEHIGHFAQIMEETIAVCSPIGMSPYLHFEAHGNKNGLVLRNGELLSWEVLYEYFVRINEKLKNQLFVSFASCYGAYIFQVINPLRRSPLFAFIGPPKQALVSDIEADFYDYFDVLLQTKDFNLAINALNNQTTGTNKYVFNSSESIFYQVGGDMLALYQTRPARRNKIEQMVKEAWKDPANRSVYSKEYLRNHFGKMLDDRPRHIQNIKDYFLFIRATKDFLI